MFAECSRCLAAGDVSLPELTPGPGLLACATCGAPMTRFDVSPWAPWIDEQVRRRGSLATRKQSACQSDAEISRDGIAAELASCILLAPNRLVDWMRQTGRCEGNRGRDLPTGLTGLDRPVETKQTRWRSDTAGFLIVRPPRMTPGNMRVDYIDDSIYVLLHGSGFDFSALGWIDRDRLVRRGRLDPVPCPPGRRHCWGIHWKLLSPFEELAGRFQQGRLDKAGSLAVGH